MEKFELPPSPGYLLQCGYVGKFKYYILQEARQVVAYVQIAPGYKAIVPTIKHDGLEYIKAKQSTESSDDELEDDKYGKLLLVARIARRKQDIKHCIQSDIKLCLQ